MEQITFNLILRYTLSIALLVALVIVPIVMVLWYRRGTAGSNEGYIRALREALGVFVLAAERYFNTGEGKEKKEFVLRQIDAWCERRKIPFDPELVDALIEEVVYNVVNGPKGVKAQEIQAALSVESQGGDARALPFTKGEAPVIPGPPPVELES